jgi:hypothetical protein
MNKLSLIGIGPKVGVMVEKPLVAGFSITAEL